MEVAAVIAVVIAWGVARTLARVHPLVQAARATTNPKTFLVFTPYLT